MATEIERKYLVVSDEWRQHESVYYCQGYLNRDKNRTVRIRIAGDEAMLTVKGPTEGATRAEFEYAVPMDDAKSMMLLCDGIVIEKNRRKIDFDGLVWEVDEFLGENAGLVVAEVELESESQTFETPDWVGQEVTDDPRYFNSRLSSMPFTKWEATL